MKTFTTGRAFVPMSLKDKALASKIVAANENNIYANKINLQKSGGNLIDQGSFGICYFVTSVNWARYWVWRHTGIIYNVSNEFCIDAALDGRDIGKRSNIEECREKSWGGSQIGIKGLFVYNDNLKYHFWNNGKKSDFIEAFLSVCKKCGITYDNVCGPNFSADINNLKLVLNKYGPFYWGHNPLAYCNQDGGHAILGMGYDIDNKKFYFKNSWANNFKESYTGYGSCSFDNFIKYTDKISGESLKAYTDRMFYYL